MLEEDLESESGEPASEERTVWKSRPSQWTNLRSFVLAGLAGLFFLVLAGLGVWKWQMSGLFGWACVVLAIGAELWALWRWLVVHNTVFELTSERLLLHRGVLNKTSDQLELYRVKDYRLEEPFWFRLVGLSNLVLLTSDKTSPQVVLPGIRNGKALFKTVRDSVERLRERKRVREVDFD